MAEYRRIVSYLYEYKNGKRGENVGYVRVQRTKEQIKIVMNIKDSKNTEDLPLRLYFYIHNDEKLQGVFVDNLFLQKGNCEYKKSFLEKELFRKGQTLEQMQGMLVYYNRAFSYGTEWDNKKIEVGQFMEGKAKFQEKIAKKAEGAASKEEAEKKAEQERGAKQEKPKKIGEKPELIREKQNKEAKEEGLIHMQEQDEVEKMFLEYPKIPNIETEELSHCVKIHPRDIEKLAQVNWWLRNNRLLLYRFEQYHHLLLAQSKNQDGSWQSVLGIPGVFDNKERYLASLFQFYHFIPVENTKYRTGSFGYWVTPIK